MKAQHNGNAVHGILGYQGSRRMLAGCRAQDRGLSRNRFPRPNGIGQHQYLAGALGL